MHRFLGFAPVFMSLFCIALVLAVTARFCAVPQMPDEDASAHIFQLLMAAQLPMAFAFVVTGARRPFLELVPVLALQVFAWSVAWLFVYELKL